MNTTAEYIAALREQTGLNNYQLAKTFEINQSNFNKYANGSAQLSVNHAFIVAQQLGLSAQEVLVNTRIEKAKTSNNALELDFWLKQSLANVAPASTSENIVIAQFSPLPLDIEHNTRRIIEIINAHQDADLLIFPELSICGYSPNDMLWHHGFMERIETSVAEISHNVHQTMVIIGCPTRLSRAEDVILYNSALLIQHDRIQGMYHKQCLPNYSVFDEQRYFTPGDGTPLIFSLNNRLYSVIICEDTWSQNVIKTNINSNIDTIISINSSPFSYDKYSRRISTFTQLCKGEIGLIYVNSSFCWDALIFDGGSFVLNTDGDITTQLEFFKEEVQDISSNNLIPFDKNKYKYNALVYSISEYFMQSKYFEKVYIALSGGIDSAFTLTLAVDAIGSDKVVAVMMPYTYTSSESLLDAKTQAQMLQVEYHEIPIHPMVESMMQAGIATDGIAHENIQARIRGSIIMSLANEHNGLVLTTSNKSESSVGYATLYGDMVGGFAPIKDVYKTEIYHLASYRNTYSYVIPIRVLEKEPSAELAEGQKDSNSLPSYELLDAILELFVDRSWSVEQIINKGFEKEVVERVIRMVIATEYKRYQSPIGPKYTHAAFDSERRYPIVNKYQFTAK